MTNYQTLMLLKSESLTYQALILLKSSQIDFYRTGKFNAEKVEKITELKYKAGLLQQAVGRAHG